MVSLLFWTDTLLLLPRDDAKYSRVVRISGLLKDMMQMEEGDQSDIADLSLTSSQKQRISIARCLYHDSDIVFFEGLAQAI